MRRRTVLFSAGAVLAAPFLARSGLAGTAADVDVVIVGAGAAGLSAARTLMAKKVGFRLLEASPRIGGRAMTDTATFGTPFDWGCTFLHQSQANPWVDYAKQAGFATRRPPDEVHERYWRGQTEAGPGDVARIVARYGALRRKVLTAGRSGKDISISAAATGLGENPWDPMILQWFGPGLPPGEAAVLDWFNALDGPDLLCPAGFGTLVAHFGQDIPVTTDTPVTHIDWSGPGIAIHTRRGVLRARHCILTVSNGVLLGEAIRFTPALTNRLDRMQGLPMASYLTVGLKLARPGALPTPAGSYANILTDSGQNMNFYNDFNGSSLVRVNLHGDLARRLTKAGEAAAVDLALERLRAVFGKAALSEVVTGAAYAWDSNPHVRGSWSAARPGHARRRPGLRRPEGGRLHFAGEAYHPSMFQTCGGAFLSGREVAARVAALARKE